MMQFTLSLPLLALIAIFSDAAFRVPTHNETAATPEAVTLHARARARARLNKKPAASTSPSAARRGQKAVACLDCERVKS